MVCGLLGLGVRRIVSRVDSHRTKNRIHLGGGFRPHFVHEMRIAINPAQLIPPEDSLNNLRVDTLNRQ